MLDNKRFEECIFALCEVYGKDAPTSAWIKITKRCMDSEGVTTHEFEQGVFKLMKVKSSKEVFNLPSPADFLEVIGRKPKGVEQIAEEQCELVFSSLKDMNRIRSCMFSDRVTNHVLSTYSGGLRAMVWDFDESNRNKKEVTWGRKDFKDRYIAAYDLKLSSTAPHKLKGLSGWANFGDEAKCLENASIHKANINVIQSRKETPQVGITIKRNK